MKTNPSALVVPLPARPAANTNALGSDIRDIKGPVPIADAWTWTAWTLAILSALVVAAWLWRRWRRRRRATEPVPVVIPPHVRARERLREALALLRQPRAFCILVSDTIRLYLQERFTFHAPDRTTEEFLEELQASALLSLAQKRSLADFLMRCDLAKFARYEPGEPELRELYEAALRLIDETEQPAMSATAGPSPSLVPAAGSE